MKKIGLFFFIVLMPVFTFGKKNSHEEIGQSWNYAYLSDFDGLFDQTEILQSEEYKNAASQKEKEDILENHFLEKKMNAVVESLKGPSGFLMTAAAILGVSYKLNLYRYLPFSAPNPAILAAGSVSSTLVGLSLFYSQIHSVSDWVKNNVWGVCSSIYQYLSGQTFDALEAHERAYLRKKPQIASGLQKSIEKQLLVARTGNDDFSSGDGKKDAQLAAQLIQNVLSLPATVKETSYDRERFEAIFDCYNEDTKKELRRLVVRYVAQSQGQMASQKHAVYFKGPPGTGKTRAAKLLAEFLQVPYQEISLSDSSKARFVGSRENSPNPGAVANAMIAAGVQNFVFLIDEVDRVFNAQSSDKLKGLPNYMLMFLDPNRPSYYNEFFEAWMNKSDVYLILAGNFEIEDDALRNRLDIIPFGAISQNCKEKIVWDEYFPQIFSKYKESKFKLSEEDFTENDKTNFGEIVKNDPDPGMRTIYLKLEHYLADIILDKLEDKMQQHSADKHHEQKESEKTARRLAG